MKLFFVSIIIIFLGNCSFDNKTGIWKNENNLSDNDEIFKDFKTLVTKNSTFDKTINLEKNFVFNISNPIKNLSWTDIFYDETNNYENYSFTDDKQFVYLSKKLTKALPNNFILLENNNVITSDQKGNIIIFSSDQKKIINKFNFYKNKYKKIEKILNFSVSNNIIYVSDNIGYLYAFDYVRNKVLWAKNYKTPFRSNLKLFENKLILANQNNNLFFININNGETLKLLPTEEITIQNKFRNNLSANQDSIFFLNTYGSLYSVNLKNMRINWFLNLNQSFDLNPSNLFLGSQIINSENKISVSSSNFTYIINSKTGSILFKINFSAKIKPLIHKNYLFVITKNDLLIAMNLKDGKVLYSYDINSKISEFLKSKKKNVEFKNLFMLNNQLYVFLKNSYYLIFNTDGNLEKIEKLPKKIHSQPIFIDGSMMYITPNGKLSIIN